MSNHLSTQSSPYLRQHADNPVDWWPWCDEALNLARTQNKPILLSIGYSACHWCHVMAHESFEDAATAALMNELYICIKVDREERPDLDKIYQLAHQALTQRSGGWPLTVFLTPHDHLPFYVGTYFPKEPRYGTPPFAQVLREVRRWWDEKPDQVRTQNSALAEFLANQGRNTPSTEVLTDAPIRAALAQIEASFDPAYGGHRGAPKFPHCSEMELLLDVSEGLHNPVQGLAARAESEASSDSATPNRSTARPIRGRGILPRSVEMVVFTLARMAAGGIHDQLGGGFARYSVDERWEIPHFEKMLCDNAQLLPLFACTSHANEDKPDAAHSAFAVAQGIVDWLAREMTAESGGFFAALDADSEHEEGKFYVWQRDEVRGLLDADEYAVAAPYYGFERPPNFERAAWNPVLATPLETVARTLGIAIEAAQTRLASAREKLFAARKPRVRPGLDDKILTSWNALTIACLTRAARASAHEDWLAPAEQALDFLYHGAWRNGRLHAKTGDDSARFPAYLDDHAFLLDALVEMLQSRWSARDAAWAIALAEALLKRFEDREHGGFFYTAHDHETLIQRLRPFTDEATPSGNGVAARALLRLGHLVGETRYLEAAERSLHAAYSTMRQMPQACCALLRALNDFLHPPTHVVVRYASSLEEGEWRRAVAGKLPRHTAAYFIPHATAELAGVLAAQTYTSGGVAYVCRGTSCLPPITDPAKLEWGQ